MRRPETAFAFGSQPHARDGADLLEAVPDVPFVLIHAGMLEAENEVTVARWRKGRALLAARPNCHVKLSGLGTFVHRVDDALIARIVGETVAMFGADRCLFGSNFPIEKLWTDYATLFAAHARASAHFDDTQRAAIFHDTAARLYRL